MFRVAIGLLIVAIIAAIFGFGGIASTATGFAKIVFVVALILAVLSFLMGGRGGGVIPLLILGTGLTAFAGTARADDVYVEPVHGTYHRQGLVLGGGLGVGHIACDGADCDGVNEAAGLNVDIGGMVGPNLAILFDAWGMSHRDGENATFSQAILTGALRFWPARLLWLQGGVGFAQASWHYEDSVIDYESRSDTVPAVMAAVGLELISSPTFALDLQLRGGTGFFEDDTQVRNLSLGVGVNWY